MIHLVPEPADASAEMRFVHAYKVSAVLALLAAGGAVAAWTLMDEGLPRLIFTLGPALFALRSFRASLRRYELVLDPAARRWRRRSGPFFATRSATGSLDDLAAVSLTLQHMRTGSRSGRTSIPVWSIALEFSGRDWDDTPLVVEMVEEDEAAAYRRLERYAQRLGADAIDRTAAVDERIAWRSAGEPRPATGSVPAGAAATGHPVLARADPRAAPPSRTGIRVTIEEGGRRIALPPQGVSFATVAGVLLGALVASFGTAFALEPLRALGILGSRETTPAATAGEVGVTLALAGAFVVVGFNVILAAMRRARSREWVLDLPDRLRFGVTRGGSASEWTELPKAAIEEVALRAPEHGGGHLRVLGMTVPVGPRDPARAALVRVRTDHDLVRLGLRLSPEGKAWLRDTIAAAVRDHTPARAPGNPDVENAGPAPTP